MQPYKWLYIAVCFYIFPYMFSFVTLPCSYPISDVLTCVFAYLPESLCLAGYTFPKQTLDSLQAVGTR